MVLSCVNFYVNHIACVLDGSCMVIPEIPWNEVCETKILLYLRSKNFSVTLQHNFTCEAD